MHQCKIAKLNKQTKHPNSSNLSLSKSVAGNSITTVNGPAASVKRITKMRELLKLAKRKADSSSTTEENNLDKEAYQYGLEWLQDCEEPDPNESLDALADSANPDKMENRQAVVGAFDSVPSNKEMLWNDFPL